MATSLKHGLPRPPDDYGAGCPSWMDPEGNHGKVIVLSLKTTREEGLPKNHPFVVGKSIQQAIGDIYTAVTEARGTKYIVKVRNQGHATKLLSMQKLFDGTPIEITVHPSLNYSRCIVNCPEVAEMTQDELLTELKPQGVTAVRRFTRLINGVKTNTSTIVLTMDGTTWPQYIMFGALRVPTRFYVPTPMLCYNCLEYGHTKARCKNTVRCQNCSEQGHTVEGCKEACHCFHCQQGHRPIDRKCALYQMENDIVRIKVEQGITYPEAKKCYETRTGPKSYANISKNLAAAEQDAKDKEIVSLKEEIAALRNQLNAVITELKKRPNCQCQMNDGTIKKDQRYKRAKEASPETVTTSDFRPPPLKKAIGEQPTGPELGSKMEIELKQNKTEDHYDTAISDTNTDPRNTDNDSDTEQIVINRKGKKKHNGSKNGPPIK